jgi:transcriptional regulator with XRE-family HTH domain
MLNENIARLRKNRGLTQVEFSKQLHVTQSAVSHWESGRSVPDTVQLFRIAEFFGVSVETLSNMKHESTTQSEPPAPVPAQEKTPADDPLTEQIMAKARTMNEEELRQLLRIMDAVKK